MAIPLGSGAGAFGAGEGPAGHDPEDEPSDRVIATPVKAVYFEPFNRRFSQNSDLTMVEGTAPIQRAALLMLPLGSMPTVASSGLNIKRIRAAAPEKRKRVIEDELRVAWKVLLDAGLIAMGAVTLEPGEPWSGKFYVEVEDLVSRTNGRTSTTSLVGKA